MGHNNSIWRITTYSHVVRKNIENGKKESQYISIIVFVKDWILNWISAIDWVRGQQQFCLTWRICCPKPQGQTKLLLSEKPVYNCFVVHLHFFPKFSFSLFPLAYLLDVFNILVREVRESRCPSTLWRQYHVTNFTNEKKLQGFCCQRNYCIAFILEKKWWCITKGYKSQTDGAWQE